jgi:hypothetical protein
MPTIKLDRVVAEGAPALQMTVITIGAIAFVLSVLELSPALFAIGLTVMGSAGLIRRRTNG